MNQLKDIALELLDKYQESETSLIWETSGDVQNDLELLETETEDYYKLINSFDDVDIEHAGYSQEQMGYDK